MQTCEHLLTNSDFLGFCHCWKRDYRCPLSLPDWLREQGLDRQAEVAEWAVKAPERSIFLRSPVGGPTPYYSSNRFYRWNTWLNMAFISYCDDIMDNFYSRYAFFDTFTEAIVWLLDNCNVELQCTNKTH